MSARQRIGLETAVCESCRKPLGKFQLTCPRRGLDGERGCTFQVEEGRIIPCPKVTNLLIGLVLVSFGAGSRLFGWENEEGLAAFLFGLIFVIGLLLMGLWVYRSFGRYLRVTNPVTGQELLQTSLFGTKIDWTLIGQAAEAAWQGSPAREMRYPASVVELYRQGNAADMVSTALLQLVAQDEVVIRVSQVRRRFGRRKLLYRLAAGKGVRQPEIQGELERRIFALVQAGPPAGLPLRDVIETLFNGGQASPRNYLIDEIIGPEAEALGLGDVRGKVKRALVAAPNTVGRVALDIQSLEQLHRDFWVTMPEHASEMLVEIDQCVIMMLQPR